MGYIDFETLNGTEGVGLANIVINAQDVVRRNADKQLKTLITFEGGPLIFFYALSDMADV